MYPWCYTIERITLPSHLVRVGWSWSSWRYGQQWNGAGDVSLMSSSSVLLVHEEVSSASLDHVCKWQRLIVINGGLLRKISDTIIPEQVRCNYWDVYRIIIIRMINYLIACRLLVLLALILGCIHWTNDCSLIPEPRVAYLTRSQNDTSIH